MKKKKFNRENTFWREREREKKVWRKEKEKKSEREKKTSSIFSTTPWLRTNKRGRKKAFKTPTAARISHITVMLVMNISAGSLTWMFLYFYSTLHNINCIIFFKVLNRIVTEPIIQTSKNEAKSNSVVKQLVIQINSAQCWLSSSSFIMKNKLKTWVDKVLLKCDWKQWKPNLISSHSRKSWCP